MTWNIEKKDFVENINSVIINLIKYYPINVVPLEYIYKNIDCYLKKNGIFLKYKNRHRSVKVYIKKN